MEEEEEEEEEEEWRKGEGVWMKRESVESPRLCVCYLTYTCYFMNSVCEHL